MKRYFSLSFNILIFLAAVSSSALAGGRSLHVIPAPKKITWREGVFTFEKGVYIVAANPADETERLAAQQLREEVLRDTGVDIPVRRSVDPAGNGMPVVIGMPGVDSASTKLAAHHGVATSDLIIPESYVLSIGRGSVLVAGADSDGVFWAAQTLKMIMRGDRSEKSIPALRIDDSPTFHFRGVEMDVSRGPLPTMATLKQTVERLSELKINKLTLYIENVFCFKKHPDIPPRGGCYTGDEIKEIGAYARRYHVELVGGLQSFGHEENLLKIPRYKPLAEQQDKPSVLSPANPGTYKLLADMYSEIVPLFDSKLFVIGCDETGGLGEGQSRELAEKMGIEGMYAYHINKLSDMLEKYGKRPMMWADIALQYPKIIGMLPKDVIMLPWEYHVQTSFDKWLKPLADAHLDFIASAGITNWSRIFPEVDTALSDIRQFALDGARYNAMGLLNSEYNDDGETLLGYDWFPLAFGAEASWNPFTADVDAFRANYGGTFHGETGGNVVRAIKYIAEAQNIMEMEYLADKSFFAWPPAIVTPNMKGAKSEAKRAESLMARALDKLAATKTAAKWNAGNIDYVALAVRRVRSVARHKIAWIELNDQYDRAAANPQDREAVKKAFADMDSSLSEIIKDTRATLAEYRRLWMAENHPYFFNMNEAKYKDLIAKIEKTKKSLEAAKTEYMKTGQLPDKRKLEL